MSKTLSLYEIQECLFDILTFFADLCDQNRLTYSLCGGTLLGAIRHQDFIPWDDDVDVFMPRPDYERLRKILSSMRNDKYRLISIENRLSEFPFLKIIATNITIKEKYSHGDQHLWIDIFPVDGMPDDYGMCAKILWEAQRMKQKLCLANAVIGKGKTPFRALVKIPAVILCKIRGGVYYGRKIEAFAQRYDFENSKNVASVVWSCGIGELLSKDSFTKLVSIPFHGKEFWAIAEWDNYLTAMYGDYMQLPPEDKRETHHFIAISTDS